MLSELKNMGAEEEMTNKIEGNMELRGPKVSRSHGGSQTGGLSHRVSYVCNPCHRRKDRDGEQKSIEKQKDRNGS